VGRQRVGEGLLDGRVVAPDGEHAEPGQEVEVALAGAIEEVLSLGAGVVPIEADGLQHADELRVQVFLVQREALARALAELPLQIEGHRPPGARPVRSKSGPPPDRLRATSAPSAATCGRVSLEPSPLSRRTRRVSIARRALSALKATRPGSAPARRMSSTYSTATSRSARARMNTSASETRDGR